MVQLWLGGSWPAWGAAAGGSSGMTQPRKNGWSGKHPEHRKSLDNLGVSEGVEGLPDELVTFADRTPKKRREV